MAAVVKTITKAAAIYEEYIAAYHHYNRVIGQLKRYTEGNVSFDDIYKVPKRITEGSIRALNKAEQEARRRSDVYQAQKKEEERQDEQQEAKTAIDNLLELFEKNLSNVKTTYAKLDVEIVTQALESIINRAKRKHGYRWVYKKIREFSEDYEEELTKLQLAIYNEEYNTNKVYYMQDKDGNVGRSKFEVTFTRLAKLLGESVPINIQKLFVEVE